MAPVALAVLAVLAVPVASVPRPRLSRPSKLVCFAPGLIRAQIKRRETETMKNNPHNNSSSGSCKPALRLKPVVSLVPPAVLIFGLLLSAAAGDTNFGSANLESPVSLPSGASASLSAVFERAPSASPGESPTLRLDFRNTPLDAVLNYYSEAGGFIILLETQTAGNLNLISPQPATPDEAVNLLNSALHHLGCSAIREGRTLTILDQPEAQNSAISVKTGNDPAAMPKTDEIATWIIPVRFIEAGTLIKDLSSFISRQATIVANAAGNALVVTDTQAHIQHLTRIIQAMDNSAETETEIRLFPLKFANPSDVESELNSIFQNGTSSGNGARSLDEFEGGGDDFAATSGDGNANSSQNDRFKRATQVTAVADARLQAVIVSAPKNLMAQVASIMDSLDVASERDQNVLVYHLNNGDPTAVAAVLQGLFQSSGTSDTTASSSQTSALQQRAANSATTTSSSSTSSTTTTSAAGGSAGAR